MSSIVENGARTGELFGNGALFNLLVCDIMGIGPEISIDFYFILGIQLMLKNRLVDSQTAVYLFSFEVKNQRFGFNRFYAFSIYMKDKSSMASI